MVATVLEQNLDSPRSLCDWVRDFRIKKVAMRRRRGGDLRVAAILSTALVRAESELRRKQNERALKWSELQSKLLCKETSLSSNINNHNSSNTLLRHSNQLTTSAYDSAYTNSLYNDDDNEEMDKQRKQIETYWKSELSSLDEFFNNLSSNNSMKRPSDTLS